MAEPNEPPRPAEPPEEFLLRHLPMIERMASSFARNRRLQKAEIEDFQSWVKEKLLEDDYRRIRAYRGDCLPKPFLAVTVSRLGKDFLDKIWGRWHSSAKAKQLGPVAIWLERLVYRDGHKFDDACEILRSRHGVTLSKSELEAIFRALPPRPPQPHSVTDDVLQEMPSQDHDPEEGALLGEAERRRREILGCLERATRSLPSDERLFLRLHMGGMTLAEIARAQKLDQKSLYRRKDRLLLTLREILGSEGVGKDEIDPLF